MDSKLEMGVLILRVVLGLVFLMHGLDKIFGIAGGSIEGTTGMLSGIGFSPASAWAWVLALSEAVAGGFLILGILPRLSASVIAVIMLVAIFMVHGAKGFFLKNGGMEYTLVLLAASIYFILAGGGRYSLFDKM